MTLQDDVLVAVRDWLAFEGVPSTGCKVKFTLRNQNEAALMTARSLEQRRAASKGALPDGVAAMLDGIEVTIGA
jgi:hypothetical protein